MNDNPLLAIPAFLSLNESLATCGQPDKAQFAAVAQAGFEIVVDLRQHRVPGPLEDEAGLAEALGMRYIPIPVQWQAPACGPLHRFFGVMRDHGEKKILVHCADNRRVSVFIYLWRRVVLGWDASRAGQDLRKIWQPDPTWQAFIDQELSDNGIAPNGATTATPV